MLSNDLADIKTLPNKNPDEKVIGRPHSLIWRIIHNISFLIGGTTFIAGSCMYFAKIIVKSWALNTGAALFIVGSFFFLVADIQDWWYHRVGCMCDWKYREDYEIQNGSAFGKRHSLSGQWRRSQAALNVACSVLGSVCYLIGSVMFLPDLEDQLGIGEGFFIAGSAIIYLSQGWKVFRIGCINKHDLSDTRFRLKNLLDHLLVVFIDVSAGLGGFFYFIGTILFLPKFIETDFGLNRSAGLFLTGGFFFTLAGVLLVFHYFCTRHE